MRRHLPLLALLLAATLSAHADTVTRFVAAPASRLVLEGTSNVTDWRCSGTTLQGAMEVAAPLERINAVIDRIEDGNVGALMADPASARFPQPSFELRVPVEALRCGKKAMEKDMARALRADRFPEIEFRFTGLRGGVDHDIDQGIYRARVDGVLELAGKSRDIEVAVAMRRESDSRFRIHAAIPLKMTDFGVTPPTALFGMIHADDALQVEFDLVLQIATAPRVAGRGAR